MTRGAPELPSTVPVDVRPVVPGRALAVGSELADRYRLVRFVAAGGMGEVYEADDRALGVRVALKTLRPGLADDPAMLARFRRELHVARTVTDPHVCRVFDLGEDDGPPRTLFLTMELLRGESLAARLARAPIGRGEARRLLAGIVAGLDAAHRAGVVHRDLKPANVMLATPGPRAVITDFGLALARGDATTATDDDAGDRETRLAGTLPYLAPELLTGSPPSVASDLYALGVVMFQLATGRLPRQPSDFHDRAGARAPVAMTGLRWRDRRWEAVMRRCLAPEPGDRPASAAAIGSALGGAARGRWIAAAGALALAAAAAALLVARPGATPAPGALRPPRGAAGAAYLDGVRALDERDVRAARGHLRAAAALAPGHPLALAQLAAAELAAGDPWAARVAARRAELAVASAPARWTGGERILVEARAHEARGDWPRAMGAWRALIPLAPTTGHRLALVADLVAAGDVAGAQAELAALAAAGERSVAIDLAAAAVADRAGAYTDELRLGRAVVAAARTPLVAARGQLAIASAAVYLGDDEAFAAAIAAADDGFTAAGDDVERAEVARVRSAWAWMHGDLAAATAHAEDALARFTAAGDLRGRANTLGGLSVLANRRGDFDRAVEHALAARAAYVELADHRQIAWAHEQLGNIAYMRDDLEAARARWLDALAVADAAGDRVRAGDLAFNLGEVALVLGDVGAARLYVDAARAHYQATGSERGLAELAVQAGALALARDDRAAAGEAAGQARAAWLGLGLPVRAVAADLLAARTARAGGDVAGALTTLARAAATAELEPAMAFAIAIEEAAGALELGDRARARAALARAAAAYPSPPPDAARTLAGARAWLAAADGRRAEALATIDRLRAEAPAREPFGRRAELELVLLAGERAGGRAPREAAAALADAAADRGLALVARRARALAR